MSRIDHLVLMLSLSVVGAELACAPTSDEQVVSLSQIKTDEDLRLPHSNLLIRALADGLPGQRVAAARAMGRIQSNAYLDALGAAAAGGNRELRLAALFAVGQFGLLPGRPVDSGAVRAVRPLLLDDDPAIVAEALTALGKLAPDGAPEQIYPFLSHRDSAVRIEAAFGLFRSRFAPVWRGEVDEPPQLPRQAVEAIFVAMRDPLPDVRYAATYLFSRYGDPRARRALIDAATDRDERVRLFAVRSLGHVVNDATIPHLIARLRDESARIRTEAVVALGRGGSFDVLGRVRDDASFHVRVAVATTLAQATSPRSLNLLRDLVDDPSVSVRTAAIEALSLRLGPAVLDRVERWATSDDWRIRAAASRAVGRAGSLGASAQIRAFADRDLRVRAALLDGLTGQPSGDEIVLAALRSDDLAIRAGGVDRVAEREQFDRLGLLGAAYDASSGEDWIEVRESIVTALATIPDSAELLRRIAATDAAPSVRRKAGAGAARSNTAPLIEPPAARTIEPPAVRTLEPSPPGVEVLLETARGTLRIALFEADAPVHVAAFLKRVDSGFYNGLIWHRVVSDFVIQGGDPRGDGWGIGGETLRDEINRHRYSRGTLGMPKAGKDTGGCQLFITHVPAPHLDGNYTVFGQVVEGLDVIDAIEVGDVILRARRAASSARAR